MSRSVKLTESCTAIFFIDDLRCDRVHQALGVELYHRETLITGLLLLSCVPTCLLCFFMPYSANHSITDIYCVPVESKRGRTL